MLSEQDTMNAGARIKSASEQKQHLTRRKKSSKARLIKQEVQEKMDVDAAEGSMDTDGNDVTIGT